MEILGIGPTELLFIIFIALIILGPKDMQKAGQTIGRWLRNLVTSDGWRTFKDTSREIRNLPNRLIREANLEELDQVNKEIGQIGKDVKETVDKNIRQDRYGVWGKTGSVSTPPPAPKAPAQPRTDSTISSPEPPTVTAGPEIKPEKETDLNA